MRFRLGAVLCLWLPVLTLASPALSPNEQADAVSYLNALQEIRDKKVTALTARDNARTERAARAEVHALNVRIHQANALSQEEFRDSEIRLRRATVKEKLKANFLEELDWDYRLVDFRRSIDLGDFKKVIPLAQGYVKRWEVKLVSAELDEQLAKANLDHAEWRYGTTLRLHGKGAEAYSRLIEERSALDQARRDLVSATERRNQVKTFVKESIAEMERIEKANLPPPTKP